MKLLGNLNGRKFLPSLLIQFCFILSYILLQELKIKGLMETGLYNQLSAAHLWGGLPLSIIFVLGYFKVTNVFERRHHMTLFLVPFAAFFLLYAYVLYPNQETLHLSDQEVKTLLGKYPDFQGLILTYAHWSTSLLMMLIDIWSSFAVGVLFWQFMNDTNSLKEARITYPLLGLGVSFFMSLSLFVDQWLLTKISSYQTYLPLVMTLIAGLWGIALLMQKHLLKDVLPRDKKLKSPIKEKLSLGVFETLGHVLTSSYLGLLAVMVLSFGMMMNLLMRLLAHYKGVLVHAHILHDVNLSKLTQTMPFVSALVALLMAGLSIHLLSQKKGWLKTALVTPIIITLICGALLVTLGHQQSNSSSVNLFTLIVFLVVLLKQVKPFFFKPIKEMAYIPLPHELKVKGKASIDLVIERFAVALGTPLFGIIAFFMFKKDLSASLLLPTLLTLLVLCGLYTFCVIRLSKQFEAFEKKSS